MPIYIYRVVGAEEKTFEIRQSIHDAPLTRHPETGEPVERVITSPGIISSKLGDASIANAGFKKFTKNSDGGYDGPD